MNKYHIIILVSVFSTKLLLGQEVVICDNEVFIRNDNKTDISKSISFKYYKLIDSLDEGCYSHKIIKDSLDYFLIIPFEGTKKQLAPLWLKKNDLIRMAIRHTEGTVTIYSEPDIKSKIKQVFDIKKVKIFDQPVVVLNCRPGWYKINLIINGKEYIGWTKEEELCSNPCSTCS